MKAENSKKWVRVFAVALTLVLAVTGTYAATAGGTEGAVNFSAPISVKEVPQKMMPGSVLIYDSQLQPKVIKGGYIENETQPNPETEDSRKGSILKYLRPVSITDDMSADEKKLAEWENRLVSDFRKQILSKPLPPKTPFQPTIYPGMKVVYNEITGDINNIYYLDPDAEDPSGYSLHNIPAAGN